MSHVPKIIPVLLVPILALGAVPTPGVADEPVFAMTARANCAFACDLYAQLADRSDNLFFSPHSISTALAMTWAGARGRTEVEIREVLHFPAEQEALHRAFGGLGARLEEIRLTGRYELSVTNALWCQEGLSLLEPFVDTCREHYGSDVRPVDFAGRTEEARLTINRWVAQQTRDRITDILAPGVLTTETALALCNAIYFKGDWEYPFEKHRTRQGRFHVAPEETVLVAMMHQKEKLRLLREETFAALELPYEGRDLSMVIFLPAARDGLAAFETTFTAAFVDSTLRALSAAPRASVDVTLPKFATTGSFELAPVLAEMGMPHAFADADFSGITGAHDLFLTNVVHRAFIGVDEKGTEAGAATIVTYALCSFEQKSFVADHPFVYLIRENSTGSVLFMGRIADPTE